MPWILGQSVKATVLPEILALLTDLNAFSPELPGGAFPYQIPSQESGRGACEQVLLFRKQTANMIPGKDNSDCFP